MWKTLSSLFLIGLIFFGLVNIVQAQGENGSFKTKIIEFLSAVIDIMIKFFQLIQEFFGLFIRFFEWIKQLLWRLA